MFEMIRLVTALTGLWKTGG